jgi:hypothetical protein
MSRPALLALTTLLAAALAITPAAAVAQAAAAPLSIATEQGGDVYRFRVGEIRVTALSDGTVPQDLHQLLQRTTPARIDALLERNFQSNPVEASINAYLIELPERTVLIDTGSGELFGLGAGGKLVASLARAHTAERRHSLSGMPQDDRDQIGPLIVIVKMSARRVLDRAPDHPDAGIPDAGHLNHLVRSEARRHRQEIAQRDIGRTPINGPFCRFGNQFG